MEPVIWVSLSTPAILQSTQDYSNFGMDSPFDPLGLGSVLPGPFLLNLSPVRFGAVTKGLRSLRFSDSVSIWEARHKTASA